MRTLNEEIYRTLLQEFGEDKVRVFAELAERYHFMRAIGSEEEEYDYQFWGLKKDYLNLKKDAERNSNKDLPAVS